MVVPLSCRREAFPPHGPPGAPVRDIGRGGGVGIVARAADRGGFRLRRGAGWGKVGAVMRDGDGRTRMGLRGGMGLGLMLALSAAAACSRFPEVAAATNPAALTAPYPALLPVDALPPPVALPASDPAGAALAARASRLRSAAGLPQG